MKQARTKTDSTGRPLTYRVADSETLAGLEIEVNAAIADGYRAVGGMAHGLTRTGHELYAQALVMGDNKGRR